MARLSGLKTKLPRFNVDEKTAKEIIGNGDLVGIMERMETLLDPDITYQILDSSACGTSQKELHLLKQIEGETLQKKIKKIASLGDFHSGWNVSLSNDNTLIAGWSIKDNESFACVCSAAVNKKQKVSDLSHEGCIMPLTYCLCCAGYCRRHLEKLLCVQLKTKEVVSSPINSKGQKPCEFIFDILK